MEHATSLDDITAGLQNLRIESGNVSYAEIARRITLHRIASGNSLRGAQIARSTVYDYFRMGRTRLNADLVAEIVLALTDDNELAANWKAKCLAAHAPASNPQATDAANSTFSTIDSHAPQAVTPANRVNSKPATIQHKGVVGHGKIIPIILAVGILANLLPYVVSQTVLGGHVPLFFDMVGTALVAIALGPWWGAVAAIVTQGIGVGIGYATGWVDTSLLFAPVAIVGALIWGYGVHRYQLARSLPSFMTLNAIVGTACTLTAFIIIMLAFDGQPMQSVVQLMSDQAVAFGVPQAVAVFLTNLMVSIVDKTLAGLIAILAINGALRNYVPAFLPALTGLVGKEMRFTSNAGGSNASVGIQFRLGISGGYATFDISVWYCEYCSGGIANTPCVPKAGLEPARPKTLVPKTSASAISPLRQVVLP